MAASSRSWAAVVGVGPGLGSAIARRFAREGFAVALMSRSEDSLSPVKAAIEADGGTALSVPGVDATDPASVSRAFQTLHKTAGNEPVDVLVYNAGAFQRGRVEDISMEDFERCWKANCFGAFASVKEVLPAMQARKRGTILLTGATAAMRGGANFSCLAVGKFGLRALAQSLARENQKGNHIHVAHIIIDGMVDLPRTRGYLPDAPTEAFLNPDAVAEEYWRLHIQHDSAWTLELDLRPAPENF